MNQGQINAIILTLIASLKEKGSWAGETHVQKSSYLLEELFGVPLELDFTLYKYGPYSFDLTDILSDMKGKGLIKLVLQQPPYGPSLDVTDSGKTLQGMYSKTISDALPKITQVIDVVKNRGVSELERITTAILVTKEHRDSDKITRVNILRELKPHVTRELAVKAIEEADRLLAC